MTATNAFSVFGLELFPVITEGNSITDQWHGGNYATDPDPSR